MIYATKNLSRVVNIAFLVLILLAAGCSKEFSQEAMTSMSFEDDYIEQEMVRELSKANVQLRIDGHTVWYPISRASDVGEIHDSVLKGRPLRFDFSAQWRGLEFVDALQKSGIESTVMNDGEHLFVYVKQSDLSIAQDIFRSNFLE